MRVKIIVNNDKNKNLVDEFVCLSNQISIEIDNCLDKKESMRHSFRLKQSKTVIKILSEYNKEIKSGNDLKDVNGIGIHTIKRIDEILEKGKLSEVKLKKKDNKQLEYVEDLERVINIGRKKAVELVTKHKIKSVSDLKKAHKNKKIVLNDKIILGLKYVDKYKQNIPRKEIDQINIYLYNKIKEVDTELYHIICGSYRREKDISNDIDILITHPNIKTMKKLQDQKDNYLRKLVQIFKKDKFLVDDLTDKDYINKYMGFCKYNKNPIRRIDIRYIPYSSYYSAILYFTGSGDFNKKMRNIAIDMGYKLNEYGLYLLKNNKSIKIKIKSEKDIFDALGMEYVEPKNRLVKS